MHSVYRDRQRKGPNTAIIVSDPASAVHARDRQFNGAVTRKTLIKPKIEMQQYDAARYTGDDRLVHDDRIAMYASGTNMVGQHREADSQIRISARTADGGQGRMQATLLPARTVHAFGSERDDHMRNELGGDHPSVRIGSGTATLQRLQDVAASMMYVPNRTRTIGYDDAAALRGEMAVRAPTGILARGASVPTGVLDRDRQASSDGLVRDALQLERTPMLAVPCANEFSVPDHPTFSASAGLFVGAAGAKAGMIRAPAMAEDDIRHDDQLGTSAIRCVPRVANHAVVSRPEQDWTGSNDGFHHDTSIRISSLPPAPTAQVSTRQDYTDYSAAVNVSAQHNNSALTLNHSRERCITRDGVPNFEVFPEQRICSGTTMATATDTKIPVPITSESLRDFLIDRDFVPSTMRTMPQLQSTTTIRDVEHVQRTVVGVDDLPGVRRHPDGALVRTGGILRDHATADSGTYHQQLHAVAYDMQPVANVSQNDRLIRADTAIVPLERPQLDFVGLQRDVPLSAKDRTAEYVHASGMASVRQHPFPDGADAIQRRKDTDMSHDAGLREQHRLYAPGHEDATAADASAAVLSRWSPLNAATFTGAKAAIGPQPQIDAAPVSSASVFRGTVTDGRPMDPLRAAHQQVAMPADATAPMLSEASRVAAAHTSTHFLNNRGGLRATQVSGLHTVDITGASSQHMPNGVSRGTRKRVRDSDMASVASVA